MKKIIMFLSAFVFGIIALFSGYNAYAEGTLTGGVQNGVQTQNMTIDEGLKILGLDPNEFSRYQYVFPLSYDIDLDRYLNYLYNENEPTPVECLGITESYEFVETSGYIDTYVYLYSPYAFDYSLIDDSFTYTDGSNVFPFMNYISGSCFMMLFNQDKMDSIQVDKDNDGVLDSEGWFYNINGYESSAHDHLFNYQEIIRPYVESADDDSIAKGVVRIRFRMYTKDDLKVERNYYFEKFLFNYYNPYDEDTNYSNCTPSFNSTFSALKEDGSVDTDKEYDEEFTDTDIFQVKNKSVVCVEVKNYIYNTFLLWQRKGYCFILLRNKETGEYIDNCQSMQIIYKLDGDEQYRSIRQDNLGNLTKFKFGNAFSESGQFQNYADEDKSLFKDKVVPELEENYSYSEYPQYVWIWNFKVEECQTIYVWYEVEKGTIVQGSAYVNGLHTEYDDNGDCLGVFDKDGKKVENVKYTEDGVILNDDGTTKLPENSSTEIKYEDLGTIDPIVPDFINPTKPSIFEKIGNWWNDKALPFLNQYKYWIIGIGAGVLVLYIGSKYSRKKKE